MLVCRIVGLVVCRRLGKLAVVVGNLLLDIRKLRLDTLDSLAQAPQQFLLLLALFVRKLSGRGFARRRHGRRISPALDLVQRLDLALLKEIVYAAQILLHAAVAELIYTVDDTVQKVAVVRHHDHRAVILLQGALQDILRAHVHVVRRLVEYQQVARLEHHARHGQTRPLASGQHTHLLVYILAAEQKRPEDVTQTRAYIPHGHTVQRIVDGKVALHQIILILGIVTYIDIGADTYRTLRSGQFAHNHARHRGLTLAVAAHEGHLLAALDREGRAREYAFVAECLARILHLHDNLSRARCRRELDIQRGIVLVLDLDALDTFQLLDARLHLIALRRLVPELLDKLLGLLDHALLVLVGGHDLGTALGPQLDELRIRHLVIIYLAQRQLYRTRGDVIQKCAVVRYDQHGTVIGLEVILQPLYALDVEVVCRLVEKEYRRSAQQQLRQLDTHAPATRELARGALEIRTAETKAQKRLLDIGLARLAAEDMVTVLCLVETVQQRLILGRLVVVALGDLGRERVDLALETQHLAESLLGLGLERCGVGHLHLLRQVTDRTLAVLGHGTRRGLLLARDDTQQCGLAGAVAADQTYTVLLVDQKRHPVEERPASVTYGNVVNGYHAKTKNSNFINAFPVPKRSCVQYAQDLGLGIVGTEHGAAGHQHLGTRIEELPRICRRDAAVDLDKRIEPHAAFHLRQTTHLLHRRGYERLPPEPGLDAHHQHHLHLRQQPLQHPDIRCRLDRDSGTRSGGMYGLDADITVVRSLIVKGDIPGPRLDKACDVTHRIGYHQMHVERLGRGAAYGLHHGESERYVGHEHPIHDIYVHPLCRAAVDHAGVTVEMAEIGREHRRGYYASHVCCV